MSGEVRERKRGREEEIPMRAPDYSDTRQLPERVSQGPGPFTHRKQRASE